MKNTKRARRASGGAPYDAHARVMAQLRAMPAADVVALFEREAAASAAHHAAPSRRRRRSTR